MAVRLASDYNKFQIYQAIKQICILKNHVEFKIKLRKILILKFIVIIFYFFNINNY